MLSQLLLIQKETGINRNRDQSRDSRPALKNGERQIKKDRMPELETARRMRNELDINARENHQPVLEPGLAILEHEIRHQEHAERREDQDGHARDDAARVLRAQLLLDLPEPDEIQHAGDATARDVMRRQGLDLAARLRHLEDLREHRDALHVLAGREPSVRPTIVQLRVDETGQERATADEERG